MSAGQLATEWRAAKVTDLQVSSGQIAATAIPYDTQTDLGFMTEAFKPGSLAKSISEAARSLPLHLFHDDMAKAGFVGEPIGVANSWDDNDQRLYGIWDLDSGDKAQRARALATPDENGNSKLGYMSIRFIPIRNVWTMVDNWDPTQPDGKDHVDRTEARLVSVSLVSTPQYIGATVDWVRSAGAPGRDTGVRAVDEFAAWLEKAKTGSTI
jgi:phage head maturation protease